MWFKNIKLFKLSPAFKMDAQALHEALSPLAFNPEATHHNEQVFGWTPPFEDDLLVHAMEGNYLLRFRSSKKLLPASVVQQLTTERALQIEEERGYKPNKKQLRDLKDDIKTSLLSRAFNIHHDIYVWIDTHNGYVAIDTSSATRADEVIGLISKTIYPFPLENIQTETSPIAAMTHWVTHQHELAHFNIEEEAELCDSSEGKSIIRYVRHTLEEEDIRQQIQQGKHCVKLALTWQDRISFVLDDQLNIKKIKALDILDEDSPQTDEEDPMGRIEADLTLMYLSLSGLIKDLMVLLNHT
ncbi:MAG: recombination-associated protein RdgC [Alcaligenaceae bacterium]|nr:recombination-associated protein RdgC [Alcaligenaceae bacterium]